MRRLTTSLASLKESQAESYSVLPCPQPYNEPAKFSECHSVAELLGALENKNSVIYAISPVSLIRCGIEDYGRGTEGDDSKPTTEELFRYLEGQVPWLVSEDGLEYEVSTGTSSCSILQRALIIWAQKKLWETLSTCPLFIDTSPQPRGAENLEDQVPTRWTYTAPIPPDPSPLLKSLTALSSALPQTPKPNTYQYTLQTLSDLTGYISTQMYQPFRLGSGGTGFHGMASMLGPAEEEFKREVRALKGLVLNR